MVISQWWNCKGILFSSLSAFLELCSISIHNLFSSNNKKCFSSSIKEIAFFIKKCLIMKNKVRNTKVVIWELVKDRPCLFNSTELRREMRWERELLGKERCQENETYGTLATGGGTDADLVLVVLLKPFCLQGPKVLLYSSLPQVPVYGPTRAGLKHPVLKTKT